MLATLVPTILMTALGIVFLILSSSSVGMVVISLLFLAFCTTSITGYIIGSIFVRRGASIARVQNDFLSSVSHELRTPLTSIRIFIETLRDDRLTDPDDKRQCLDLLNQEVARLSTLVERLIELSRIETGRKILERSPIEVSLVVTDALAAFDAATLTSRVEVETDITPDLTVIGDRATLAQALSNLLINAWKYTEEGKRNIRLVAHPGSKRTVEIAVIDNGIGISRLEQKHIFDEFERGKQAIERRTSGVGLGLSTVRAIVNAHRGRIELKSRPGQGSEFRMILRASSANSQHPDPGTSATKATPKLTSATSTTTSVP